MLLLLALALLALSGGGSAPERGRHVTAPLGPRVPRERTDPAPGTPPYGAERIAAFVRNVAAAYASAGAPPAAIPFLVAHSALAVGWGRRVWGWNIGVIRAGRTWSGPWSMISTIEAHDDPSTPEVEHVPDPHAAWRVYPDLTASAADVLHLLSRPGGHYAPAWQRLLAGDRNWFSVFGRLGWYSEPPAVHQPRYNAALARTRAVLERA